MCPVLKGVVYFLMLLWFCSSSFADISHQVSSSSIPLMQYISNLYLMEDNVLVYQIIIFNTKNM